MSNIFDLMIQAAIGTSAAILLVLLVRKRVRAAFGAHTAYAMWLLVPVAMLASLLPADLVVRETTFLGDRTGGTIPAAETASADLPASLPVRETTFLGDRTEVRAPVPEPQAFTEPAATGLRMPELPHGWVLGLWLIGAAASLGTLAYGQHRFMKRHGLRAQSGKKRVSRHADVGPAVLGFVAPRIVVPSDFRDAYNRLERKLILAHEQAHIRAGDMQANALAIAIRSLNWFNPLAYIAYGFFRIDQEMACDERVMRRFGQHRRTYAETLLKSQLMGERAPLGCSWFGDTRHPLKDRVARLARRELSPTRRMLGVALLLGATSLTGVAAWATLSTQVIYVAAANTPGTNTQGSNTQGSNTQGSNTQGQVAQVDAFINPEIGMGGGLGGAAAEERDNLADDLADAQAAALVHAILERRDNHARALLTAGVNVNYHAKRDGTPLLAATLTGNREMVQALLKAGADINQTSPGDGTPLLVAARRGDMAMVQYLLGAGADVNGYSPGDGTPLLVAARNGEPTIVKLLLEAGADINQVAPGDGTPLIVAASRGSEKMVKALLDVGADVNGYAPGDGTPLLVAARHGDEKMVELLLKSGADVNLAAPGDGNPLIAAATVGDLDMVKRFVDIGADVNGFVLHDETPLIGAARSGELEIVKYLVEKGADVNMRVLSGHEHPRSRYRTALGQALRYGHDDVVTYLRKKGAADPAEQEDR